MSRHRVSASARVRASARQVYDILADYRVGHPAILPSAYFRDLVVERGGVGAGTTIRFGMRAFGTTRVVRGEVTEPEPGRVLVETYPETDTVTTFTVEPQGAGACTVTFDTELRTRDGLAGAIERWFTTAYLRRVYAAELAQLAEYAEARAGVGPGVRGT